MVIEKRLFVAVLFFLFSALSLIIKWGNYGEICMAIRISHKGFQLLKQKTTGSSGGGSEEGIFTVTSIYPALNESIAVQFLFTSNLSDRTYYWTNGGSTTAADFEENLNAGSFVTTAGTGSVTFTLIQDRFTEGSETLLFQARNGSTGGAIIASSSLLVINDTSIGEYFVGSSGTEYTPSLAGLTAYAENTAITFTVTTTAADGTLYWTNGGTTNAADLVGNVNSGSFITTAGTGSVTLTARNDTLT